MSGSPAAPTAAKREAPRSRDSERSGSTRAWEGIAMSVEQQSGAVERQLVVFELASEFYGIDINTVREIIRMQQITYVPDAPKYVNGVINLRGRVIPVVDLRRRFSLAATEGSADMRILVVDIAGEDIGVIVDAVTEVKRISTASIQREASIATTEESYYLEGIAKLEDRLLILLNLERALHEGGAPTADLARDLARAE